MTQPLKQQSGNVEPFPHSGGNASVSGQLEFILRQLRSEFPWAVSVSLSFDGFLHAHIDVRNLEELGEVETKLAVIGEGMFNKLTRGRVPNHPFLHRVSALVAS